MSNMRGFDAAQREYDNRTPPDDGPYECPECDGKRYRGCGQCGGEGCPQCNGEGCIKCAACDGFGMINENGEPFDPHQAEREACDRADSLRDESLTDDRSWADSESDDVY
jgi:hypothetical protein